MRDILALYERVLWRDETHVVPGLLVKRHLGAVSLDAHLVRIASTATDHLVAHSFCLDARIDLIRLCLIVRDICQQLSLLRNEEDVFSWLHLKTILWVQEARLLSRVLHTTC